jgi:hypothetical protein
MELSKEYTDKDVPQFSFSDFYKALIKTEARLKTLFSK